MVFVRRFFDLVLLTTAIAAIAGSLFIAVNIYSHRNDDTILVVKTLRSVKPVPKALYIPVNHKAIHRADISNAILTPRSKKAVIITL